MMSEKKYSNFTKLILRKFFKVNLDEISASFEKTVFELDASRNNEKLIAKEKKEAEQKASNLSKNLKNIKDNLVLAKKENENLKFKNNVLVGNLSKLEDKKLQLQGENDILKAENNRLNEDLAKREELSREYNANVEALNHDKEIIANERTALLEKAEKLKYELENATAELEITKKTNIQSSQEITKLQEEKNALNIQLEYVSCLEKEWIKLKENNTSLRDQVDDLKNQLLELNSELSEVKNNLSNANSIIEEKTQNLKKLDEIKSDNEKLKQENKQLRIDLNNLEKSKSNQDDESSSADDLNKLAKELDKKEKEIQTLTEEKAEKQNRITELEDELDELKKIYNDDITKLNDLLKAKISTIYDLENKIKSLEDNFPKEQVIVEDDVVKQDVEDESKVSELVTQDIASVDNNARSNNKKQAKVKNNEEQTGGNDNEDILIDLPDIENNTSVETVRSIKMVLNTQTGETISANDFFKQAPESIAFISRQLEIISRFGGEPLYVCAKCMSPVKVSKISKRNGETLFFSHCKHNVDCAWKTPPYVAAASVDDTNLEDNDIKNISYELVRYTQLKQLITQMLNKQKKAGDDIEDIDEDKKITAPNNNRRWRKYDISMRWHGKNIVFKLQRTKDYLQDLVTHDRFAKDNNYYIIWIFGSDSQTRYDYIREHNYQNTLFDNKSCVFILDKEAEKACNKTGKLHLKCNWLVDGKHWYYTLENSGTNGKLVTLDDLIFDDHNFKPYYKEGFIPNFEDNRIELKPGILAYRVGALWGLINTYLNIKTECKYSLIQLGEDGRIKATTADYPHPRTGYLSDEGEEIPTIRESFTGSIFIICTFEQWYLALDTGQRLSENYDQMIKWTDSRFIVRKDNRYGIVDYEGNVKLEPKYKSLEPHSNERAMANNSFYIDENGNIIHEKTINLKDGYKKVKHQGKWGIMKNGKLIVGYLYDEIASFRCRFYGFDGIKFIKLANQPRYNYRVPFEARFKKLSSGNYELLLNNTKLYMPSVQQSIDIKDKDKYYSLIIRNISKRKDLTERIEVSLSNEVSLNKPFNHVDVDADFRLNERLEGKVVKVVSTNGRRYVEFEDGRLTYITKSQFAESEVDINNYIRGANIVLEKIGFEDFYERTIWKVIK